MKNHIIKYIIPKKFKLEILNDLGYMNIDSSTLFPGLDGFARSLAIVPGRFFDRDPKSPFGLGFSKDFGRKNYNI